MIYKCNRTRVIIFTQNWWVVVPLSFRFLDFAPLTLSFSLNSIYLILHQRCRKSLFELKQAQLLSTG